MSKRERMQPEKEEDNTNSGRGATKKNNEQGRQSNQIGRQDGPGKTGKTQKRARMKRWKGNDEAGRKARGGHEEA